MKYPTNTKPELTVSTNKYRQSLTEVFLDTVDEQARLVSTDGHIMSIIPAEASKDEGGYISPAALKAARKLARKAERAEIACNGNLALTDGMTLPRSTDLPAFPAWRQIVPQADRPVAFRFAVNASLLATLAESLGVQEVVLTFEHANHSILVTPLKPVDNRKGIIMPCKL